MKSQVERSYLEIKSLKELVEKTKPLNDLYIEKANPPDFQLNKFFYKEVGKKHRWTDRLIWSDKKWIEYLEDTRVNTYILKSNKDLIGYFEQIFYKDELDPILNDILIASDNKYPPKFFPIYSSKIPK